ncbi:hypothetical protein IQ266_17540 [filamentous cyanobacterium LEGE 11480]|uniref:Uncharacterized protein n=1 Tax=Romeriopsis navalis LEGE 11480 TaxID=2777977 RepID=A0A928VT01_9CYAN|nr:hypothetical protein [Romeriopsis navalis]MBE9031539.1 hypothetical protein [Romeriopsis navalis LEGE 11480]
MSLQLTLEDLQTLRKGRLDRLRKVFIKPLGLCRLQMTRRDRLVVHCPEPWVVDELMSDLPQLINAAKVVVGAQSLSICFVGEEIYRTRTMEVQEERYAS